MCVFLERQIGKEKETETKSSSMLVHSFVPAMAEAELSHSQVRTQTRVYNGIVTLEVED